jgi:glycerol kinase
MHIWIIAANRTIRAVMGNSRGTLYGQGYLIPGMTKTAYSTGSSVMMNVGEMPVFSEKLITSRCHHDMAD